MILAHAGDSAHSEYLFLSLGLLVLGIIMFASKSAKVPVAIAMVVIGAGGTVYSLVGIGDGGAGTDIRISIVSPAAGAEVPANQAVVIEVELTNASVEGDADAETGHIHVFVDGELDQMRPTLRPEVVLPPGEHEITVEYVDAAHKRFDSPISDTISVVAVD